MSHAAVRPINGALPADAQPAREDLRPRWGLAEIFVLSQTVLPALLFLPGTQPMRTPLRVGAFVISLAALAVWLRTGRTRKHPSAPWLIAAFFYLVLQL